MPIEDFYREKLKLEGPLPFQAQPIHYPKKTIITAHNQVEDFLYFLNKGIVEVGFKKGKDERIIDFVFPGQFFSSYSSFLTRKVKGVYLACLTPCEVEAIPHRSVQEAYRVSLQANQFGRILTENAYLQRLRREKDFLLKSAEERYLDLSKKRPEVIKLIPGSRIAKYLGIHPESLSRIRKSII